MFPNKTNHFKKDVFRLSPNSLFSLMESILSGQYQYVLYKGNKKLICPECGKKTFVPFVDANTGNQLPGQYGRCDREVNCSYFFSPYKDGYHKGNKSDLIKSNTVNIPKPTPKRFSFVNVELFKQSRKAYEQNNFVQWLKLHFGSAITSALISRYHIGTSKRWPGSTIFWQIDKQGKIRTGKIMLYDAKTGRRVKEPYNHIAWAHKALQLPEFELQQCLFGEHLLNQNPACPVAIVESEKTAIIASAYLPRFVWLAVGSLTNLSAEKCKVLAGRNVFLFPDLNGFDKWKNKEMQLNELMPGTSFTISDYLQTNAPEADKQKGLDLADYLITCNYKEFINSGDQSGIETEKLPIDQPEIISEKGENSEVLKTTFVDSEPIPTKPLYKPFGKEFAPVWNITELEALFNTVKLPGQPIQLNNFSMINNVKNFIDSHVEILNHNNGNRIFSPYYDRLIELIKALNLK